MNYVEELAECLRLHCSRDKDGGSNCERCTFHDIAKEFDGDYTACVDKMCSMSAETMLFLYRAAKSMHTWIYLHVDNEQDAYDDCNLSDSMNALLSRGRPRIPEEDWK